MGTTLSIICTTGMLIALIGAIVFLFIGIRCTTKAVKKQDKPEPLAREVLVRSTIFLLISNLCMGLCYVGMHYDDYYNGVCSLGELLFSCFASAFRSYGWIILIPWLINMFRRRPGPKTDDTDKM